MSHGIKGKRVGEILKLSKSWSEDEISTFLNLGLTPKREKVGISEGTVLHWFVNNPCVCGLLNSSISQKRRWLDEGAVVINGKKLKSEDKMPELESLVFFPNGNKITLL